MTTWIITLIGAVLASGGLWTLIQYLISRHDKHNDDRDKDMDAVMRGLKGLLHQEIIRQGNYYVDRGDITKEELDDFRTYLYLPYKDLHGNGVADVVVEELTELTKGGK